MAIRLPRPVFALAKGSKKPPAGRNWQESTTSDESQIAELQRQGNIGIPTGTPTGIVVRDYDGEEGLQLARSEFKGKFREFFKCLVSTPNGGLHVYLRQPEFEVRNSVTGPVDLRGEGGYVLAVGSQIRGKVYEHLKGYEFRSVEELPVFPKDWLTNSSKLIHDSSDHSGQFTGVIKDVRAYVAKIESIQGKNGSAGLVRAAARCRDAGVSESEATMILLDWNLSEVVSPPWTHEELSRAITRVYSKGRES